MNNKIDYIPGDYTKFYYLNGQIINGAYGENSPSNPLHRIDGLAVEYYQNDIIVDGSYYIYGKYIGNYHESLNTINNRKQKILKQKVFE